MDKRKYYVSIQSKTIMANREDAAYELEIEATDEQLDQLHQYFEFMAAYDDKSHFRTMIPGIPYHEDNENDKFDSYLHKAYRLIHETGTDQTKSFIESNHILR
ncbi:MAG: hypothetical protein P0Y55_07605 [Candidatus Cohnella colombiensis]|uniref:Hydrolase n=1 Tax=Candidatus Cohnella colombiensis TaxID=3121368 RepID=A0AA95EZV3_9BACL|nr:MAG: hypothetical protein P0Y55_07605 [Cohnella sp.]